MINVLHENLTDFYLFQQEYHENDLDFVDPRRYLRQPSHPSWPQMKDILWDLATKQLKSTDWKKLAVHWKFTPDHIRCIEHQYTGMTTMGGSRGGGGAGGQEPLENHKWL